MNPVQKKIQLMDQNCHYTKIKMLKYNLSHVLLFFLLVSSSFSFLGMGGMGGAGGGGYVFININTFYD